MLHHAKPTHAGQPPRLIKLDAAEHAELHRAYDELRRQQNHIAVMKTMLAALNPDHIDPIHDMEQRIARLEAEATALQNGIIRFESEAARS